MESKYHQCEILDNTDDITVQKVNEKWTWIYWGQKKTEGHVIKFCPYCGKKLEDN